MQETKEFPPISSRFHPRECQIERFSPSLESIPPIEASRFSMGQAFRSPSLCYMPSEITPTDLHQCERLQNLDFYQFRTVSNVPNNPRWSNQRTYSTVNKNFQIFFKFSQHTPGTSLTATSYSTLSFSSSQSMAVRGMTSLLK